MHILISADPFIPVPPRLYGGIERVIALLIQWLRAQGHQVSLVAHPESAIAVDELVPWSYVQPAGLVSHAGNARCLRRTVARLKPDVVHSFSRLLYLAALAGLSCGLLMSYQREPTPRTIKQSSRLLGQRLGFTGCSNYIADKGAGFAGRWVGIHNFVDCSGYPWQDEVAADAPLVFLSRVESIKGAHLAIEIARRSGRRLLIAGNHAEDGPEAQYFEQQVRAQLTDEIEYVGPVDDEQKGVLLSTAAALLLPIQWNEPFGIVFAEALACGAPVITCPRGAAPEIVEPGKQGFLINDVAEGVAAVNRLNQIQRSACRQRAESAFDVNVVAPLYQDQYANLAAK